MQPQRTAALSPLTLDADDEQTHSHSHQEGISLSDLSLASPMGASSPSVSSLMTPNTAAMSPSARPLIKHSAFDDVEEQRQEEEESGKHTPLLDSCGCNLSIEQQLHTYHSYDDMPVPLKDNPFITQGYRHWGQPLCAYYVASVCHHDHNESVNIGTALFGLILWTVIWAASAATVEPSKPTTVLFVYCFSAWFCHLGSALFHVFKDHSERVFDVMLRFDLAGIVVLITGSMVSFVSITFKHDSTSFWEFVYIAVAIVVGLFFGSFVMCSEQVIDREAHGIRVLVFILLGACGLPALIQGTARASAAHIAWVWLATISTCTFYLVGAVAFFARKWPESKWPGKFNIYGASHQLWHICVLLGSISLYVEILIMGM